MNQTWWICPVKILWKTPTCKVSSWDVTWKTLSPKPNNAHLGRADGRSMELFGVLTDTWLWETSHGFYSHRYGCGFKAFRQMALVGRRWIPGFRPTVLAGGRTRPRDEGARRWLGALSECPFLSSRKLEDLLVILKGSLGHSRIHACWKSGRSKQIPLGEVLLPPHCLESRWGQLQPLPRYA